MTLQNFEKARANMVLSQLQPSGIVSDRVMETYQFVPREIFVPVPLRGVSYLDDDIALGGGRTLMEPLLQALMVQDAGLSEGDKVLDIGAGNGYSSAVLACLTGNVVALDQEEKWLQSARGHWKALGLDSKISPVIGDHAMGDVENSPYKAIFINGAVAEIPVGLLSQLTEDGALYAVVLPEDAAMGKVVAVRMDKNGNITESVLGEGVTSYLVGFEPKKGFVF